MVQEFERQVADYHDVKHCVAMCNGTVALEIAIRALGLANEVIIPSFTFVATAHAPPTGSPRQPVRGLPRSRQPRQISRDNESLYNQMGPNAA